MPTKEILVVILLFSSLDSLVVNDQVVSNDQLIMGIITQKSSMYFLFLNSKLLANLIVNTV